jgi:hypothetical protein
VEESFEALFPSEPDFPPPLFKAEEEEEEDAPVAAWAAESAIAASKSEMGKRSVAATPVYRSNCSPLTCMLLKIKTYIKNKG